MTVRMQITARGSDVGITRGLMMEFCGIYYRLRKFKLYRLHHAQKLFKLFNTFPKIYMGKLYILLLM